MNNTWFSRIRSVFGLQKREFSLQRWFNWLDMAQIGINGKVVTPETALSVSTVYAIIRIISETCATLPLTLYRPTSDGRGAIPAIDDPLHDVLKYEPNSEQTAIDFWEFEAAMSALRGNAYAQLIRYKRDGIVKEIWPLKVDDCDYIRRNNELILRVRDGATVRYLFPGEYMHCKPFSQDGVYGSSPLIYGRDTIALALGQEEFANRQLLNGARPSGVLMTDNDLDKDEKENLRTQWSEMASGISNVGKTPILTGGLKWNALQLKNDEMEFLASRKFQIAELARFWRVPLHLLAELDRSTNNNIEQQSLEFVIHCIRPWLTRWEHTIRKYVLTDSQKKQGMFVRFNERALLRGAMTDQAEFFSKMLQNGVYSPNEVRGYMDENPYEGGDRYFVNGTMTDVNAVPDEVQEPAQDPNANPNDPEAKKKEKDTQQQKALKLAAAMLADALSSIHRFENAAISKRARTLSEDEFDRWLGGFQNEQAEYIRRHLAPLLTVIGQVLEREGRDIATVVENVARKRTGERLRRGREMSEYVTALELRAATAFARAEADAILVELGWMEGE